MGLVEASFEFFGQAVVLRLNRIAMAMIGYTSMDQIGLNVAIGLR